MSTTNDPADVLTAAPSGVVTRRRFLTLAGGTAMFLTACRGGAASLGSTTTSTTSVGAPVTGSVAVGSGAPLLPVDQRVLLLVQLLGGNDGLNTVVPDAGWYHDARTETALDRADTIPLTGLDDLSLHPELGFLGQSWEAGRLGLALGAGFADQTRSHFESMDIWWGGGAVRASGDGPSGWLARWLEAAAVLTPDEPMEALALGSGALALGGSPTPALIRPEAFTLDPPVGLTRTAYDEALRGFAARSDRSWQTRSAAAVLETMDVAEVLADVPPVSDEFGAQPTLVQQLEVVAQLIRARPGLRVVSVGVNGFDTHADQRLLQDPLLADLDAALRRFDDSLGDHRARVTTLITSEFGRRVAENGSGGTDHGRGGVSMLLGDAVRPRALIGRHHHAGMVDGDLPIEVPAEELYGDALRWLGGPVGEVLGVEPAPSGLLTL